MAEPADLQGNAIELEGVTAGYGETVVLENFDFALRPGASIGVLGRNGVGKTTLLATIMGHATLHTGRILLHGRDLGRQPIHRRNALGLGYVPQEREIFPSLTVDENLAVAERPGKWTPEAVYEMFPALQLRRVNYGDRLSGGEQQMLAVAERPGKWTLAAIYRMFPALEVRRTNYGDRLSGGEQQMLAVGRALVGNPSVLLLDEPSEGLAPVIVADLQATFARLRDEQAIAIVMVEQKASIALAFAERSIVMDRGAIVYDGASATLAADRARLDRLIGVSV